MQFLGSEVLSLARHPLEWVSRKGLHHNIHLLPHLFVQTHFTCSHAGLATESHLPRASPDPNSAADQEQPEVLGEVSDGRGEG